VVGGAAVADEVKIVYSTMMITNRSLTAAMMALEPVATAETKPTYNIKQVKVGGMNLTLKSKTKTKTKATVASVKRCIAESPPTASLEHSMLAIMMWRMMTPRRRKMTRDGRVTERHKKVKRLLTCRQLW
jgi:hypothetical protein